MHSDLIEAVELNTLILSGSTRLGNDFAGEIEGNSGSRMLESTSDSESNRPKSPINSTFVADSNLTFDVTSGT